MPLLVAILVLSACGRDPASETKPGIGMDPGMMDRHMAPIPPEYERLTNRIEADAESLARGEAVYAAKCADCHGERGHGDGPAAANLSSPPAPLAHTAPMMSDAYLFYRVSEGGGFAPFNSAMPAWKDELSESERWDVINYARSIGANGMLGSGGISGMMGGWWMWVLFPLVALLADVALGAFWLVWRLRRVPLRETPIDILRRRLARGEITPEQFEVLKRHLGER